MRFGVDEVTKSTFWNTRANRGEVQVVEKTSK